MALTVQDRESLRGLSRRIDPSDAGAHNNLGVLYYLKDMTDEAVEQFSHALALDPRMSVAQRNLELAYQRSGHYDRRVRELQAALRSDPENREARWELGRAYASLTQYDAASSEFQALLTQDPNDVATIVQLALAEKKSGNLDAATEWLERARDLEPDSSVVHYYLGEVLYNRGLNAESLEELERAVELSPDHAEAHYLLAFVFGDIGRHEEARAATKRAIQLNPTYGRAQTNLSLERLTGERKSVIFEVPRVTGVGVGQPTRAHHNLGLAFRRQGYYQEALREYRLALDRGEDRLLVEQGMAEVYLLQRDHAAALDLYDGLVKELPESAKLWNERGAVLHQLGRFQQAKQSYSKALEIQEDYALAHNNLAIVLAHEGQHDGALAELRKAARSAPALVVPQLNLGLLLFKLHRFQLALDTYRKVLDKHPVAGAWNGIGLVLNELGRAKDARNAFARAVEAEPSSAEAHYNLSFALSRLGDFDGALRAVTRAQSLDPYYVPQKFRLAIDLQYDDPSITVVPEISADVSAEAAGAIDFDQNVIDELFAELDEVAAAEPTSGPTDPLALARDYLDKGLLDLAAAESDRAAGRGADTTELYVLSADIFARRGLHGEALDRYRAARELAPQRFDARLGELRQMLALGRGADAVPDALALAEEHPENVDVLVALAEAQVAAGDPANALEYLDKARGRAPQRADILKLEGDIAADMGDFDAAQQAYEGALDLEPRLAQVRIDLGRLHEARNDLKAAERAYRQALETLPTLSEAAIALARVYRRGDMPRQAVNLLVEALKSDPTDLETLLALGQALLDDGRTERAIEAFNRLIAFDDANVGAHFYRGAALARCRKYTEALREWDFVIRVDQDGRFAREAKKHTRTALDLKHIFQSRVA